MSLDRTAPTTDVQSEVLETARIALERERRELEDERIAFDRFLERLRELEATRSPPRPRSSPVDSARRTVQQPTGLTNVQEAFADTVMSVPHYYDRYDESTEEHLAGELNDELAAAVVHGTALHSQLKQSLLEATRHALDTRETLLELIEDERKDLDRVEASLRPLVDEFVSVRNQPVDDLEFNALRLTRIRLCELRDRCDELAAQRQEFVRGHRRTPLATGVDFNTYLYGTCDRTHPLLSVIATFSDRIEQELHRVERNLLTAR